MATKDVQIRNDNRPVGMFDMAPDFEDMVESFFGPRFNSLLGDWPMSSPRSTSNVQENDKSYMLTAEIPGVPKEDIEINVNGNLLTIRANQKSESKGGEQQSYRRQYRSFQQSFSLPTTVNPDQIEAHYENGVLELVLPKTAQAQAKKIEIQERSSQNQQHQQQVPQPKQQPSDAKH